MIWRAPLAIEVSVVGRDGYSTNLPLDREVEGPIRVSLAGLRAPEVHPMFAARLRVFADWHLAAGHDVKIIGPRDTQTARRLATLGTALGLTKEVLDLPAPSPRSDVLPLTKFRRFHDVEDVAEAAVELLHQQTGLFGEWGDAVHMAISELCDNALQHSNSELGSYVVADRVTSERLLFRLAIVDLGVGIPEHIRRRHPEWQDDTGAISRALVRGVSGTDDPHRGNGFAEVFDLALQTDLVQASSAATLDIRSGKGRVRAELFGGNPVYSDPATDRPRQGTWLTYTVTTAG